MKTKLVVILLAFFMVFCAVDLACATVISMNFDPPGFTVDTAAGDNPNHVYNTPYGDITFNGRIYDVLATVAKPDHTTGSDYFLKNTEGSTGEDKITMNFSFDVVKFDLWLLGKNAIVFYGQTYDINGTPIDGQATWTGNGKWFYESADSFSAPVRSIALWSKSGLGNNFAIDDLRITPIPEPASLSLLGLGLLGVLGIRKKKR